MSVLFRYGVIVFLCIAFSATLHAFSLESKYPSYTYVLNEFDIDESYSNDDTFLTYIQKHEKQLKIFYRHSLQRGKEILPTVQGLLAEDGMSDLFIYLAMVESGFLVDAVSPKKAVGLWQFMPKTARQYDLVVCDSYDERCDTQSATLAAVAYLNKLYIQFGKWYLAAMAYNCGEGCVQKAISHAGTDAFDVLTDDDFQYLPRETREYMKKILLVAMIGENASFDVADMPTQALEDALIQVDVQGGTSLKTIATLLKMPEEKLAALNKPIKDGFVPKEPGHYALTIPIEKVYAFYLRYEKPQAFTPRPATQAQKTHMISHHIALGETLQSIATRYKTDTQAIKAANHLKDEFLTVDALLVIPVSKKVFDSLTQ